MAGIVRAVYCEISVSYIDTEHWEKLRSNVKTVIEVERKIGYVEETPVWQLKVGVGEDLSPRRWR